ncbi:histidine phosphatase family protein [Lacticaseibacillus mingshuiensis]|uniref:Histidine phosphatase family protein n=1 Tax=Lacticaseibacillus mingshuiensis TaxID=2799574 RepID=A0ABW4CK25_9LACO|nr:histidine phosphatase family protein [Lacticaseibacillus mingshuiensis]
MTVHFYLVRHGETQMNRKQHMQGVTDAPLTEKGVAQADALGAALAKVPFAQAYSSDRKRAVATAQHILAATPSAPALMRLASLREYYFGGLEGMSSAQVMRLSVQRYGLRAMPQVWQGGDRFAKLVRNFQKLDDTGQAESLPALQKRMRDVFQRLADQAPVSGNVLVVGHGLSLSAMIEWVKPQSVPIGLLKNTSVTRLDFDQTTGTWQVVAVNLTASQAAALATPSL